MRVRTYISFYLVYTKEKKRKTIYELVGRAVI